VAEEAHALAVFIDFENLAIGMEHQSARSRQKTPKRFDMSKVLERLVEKGRISTKHAYADWKRFEEYPALLHELGIELTEIPDRAITGKNSADIRLVVDAMELSYTKSHIDTIVIVSGDSDFAPLVAQLKENGKRVIGVGMRDSTSNLLADNCDEFIYYEDIGAPAGAPVLRDDVPRKRKPAYKQLFEAIEALQRENVGVMHSSLVKDAMKRKNPSFTESSYGYKSFTQLLEDAQALGYITLSTDARSGTYVVDRFTGA